MTIPLSRVLRGIFILCNPLREISLSGIKTSYPQYSQVTDMEVPGNKGHYIFESD